MNKKMKFVFKAKEKVIAVILAVTLLCSGSFAVQAGNLETSKQSFSDGSYVAVAAGDFHSMALRDDGTVWTWGRNEYGQLGDGTTTDRNEPVQVVGLDNVIEISGGSTHSMALKEDGSVWCWGSNEKGELGNGDPFPISTVPVKVSPPMGFAKAKAISAGGNFSLAAFDVGLYGWGDASYGQMGGNGSGSYPIRIDQYNGAIQDLKDVSAGKNHCMALDSNGGVWTWGWGYGGALGDGTNRFDSIRITPYRIVQYGRKAISAGNTLSASLSEQDGSIWACGENITGSGGFTSYVTEPNDLRDIEVISAGFENTMAVRADGSLWGWGTNRFGILGDGTGVIRTEPVEINGIPDAKSVDLGEDHAIALCRDGSVWTWGSNQYGQLGDEGAAEQRNTPYCVVAQDSDNTDPRNPFLVRLNEQVQGMLEKAGESRYYSFTPTVTNTYRIQSISDLDTYGEVFDSSGARIAWNDDGMGRGESRNLRDFYIEKELAANETYLIRVSSSSGEDTGEFILQVSD